MLKVKFTFDLHASLQVGKLSQMRPFSGPTQTQPLTYWPSSPTLKGR